LLYPLSYEGATINPTARLFIVVSGQAGARYQARAGLEPIASPLGMVSTIMDTSTPAGRSSSSWAHTSPPGGGRLSVLDRHQALVARAIHRHEPVDSPVSGAILAVGTAVSWPGPVGTYLGMGPRGWPHGPISRLPVERLNLGDADLRCERTGGRAVGRGPRVIILFARVQRVTSALTRHDDDAQVRRQHRRDRE
jgi:hypothetical protein